MKKKLWIYQLPIILFFAFAFWITYLGETGNLKSAFLREKFFGPLRSLNGAFTNAKFKIRGPRAPKNKIVIVEIDDESIQYLGRWPWHRDTMAALVNNILAFGAKVVGLDIVFSEADQRVPSELADLLRQRNLGGVIEQFETDLALESVFAKSKGRIVTGWATNGECQPLYASTEEECPVMHPEIVEAIPAGFSKFAFTQFNPPKNWDPKKTPVVSAYNFLTNIPGFIAVSKHAGFFNATLDPDGYVRRTAIFTLTGGIPYPSLPLEMARVGLDENLELTINDDHKVEAIRFAKMGREIKTSPLGTIEVNFRGPSFHFPYVAALDIIEGNPKLKYRQAYRGLASTDVLADLLKDAYVLIGPTALGIFDMRAFPFDSNTPGVEGHATILDNILSGDYLKTASQSGGQIWILMLMIFGAVAFAYYTEKLESIAALVFFAVIMVITGGIDQKALFENGYNWNTSLFYIEIATVFVLTIAAKYVMEEKNKKFVKGAFAKYVAPSIVDTIIKDPTKLTVGGEKRDLTIMFSDIRGFTTLSEKMDPKSLSTFLNEYLGSMTDIVFEHQGTLDKYIGDAVMAFWGAPVADPNHAKNACEATIHMIRKLNEIKPVLKEKYGVEVKIGIGVNSGPVSVGNMGSERIFAYTVIGDDVNLASRLEGLTKEYGVQIITTRATFKEIERTGNSLPSHRVLDKVKVKGKNDAVEIIQLVDRDLDAKGMTLFEQGRKLYFEQKWDQAIDAFKKANQILAAEAGQGDYPCEMYVERCETFKQSPPDADWDGSWVMTTK